MTHVGDRIDCIGCPHTAVVIAHSPAVYSGGMAGPAETIGRCLCPTIDRCEDFGHGDDCGSRHPDGDVQCEIGFGHASLLHVYFENGLVRKTWEGPRDCGCAGCCRCEAES